MPSRSLIRWRTQAKAELDEMEAAHHALGGAGPGRRYATQQINQAYAVLLASQFQRYCRDLHTEAADYLVTVVPDLVVRDTFRDALRRARQLDRGNANPATIGSDFERFGLSLWDELYLRDNRNRRRNQRLESLNRWRNAIAHQDFNPKELGGRTTIQLWDVRDWRRACDALASELDLVLRDYLGRILHRHPW